MTYFSSFVNNKIQPGFFVKYLPTCKMNRYQRFESHLLRLENGKHRMSYIYVHINIYRVPWSCDWVQVCWQSVVDCIWTYLNKYSKIDVYKFYISYINSKTTQSHFQSLSHWFLSDFGIFQRWSPRDPKGSQIPGSGWLRGAFGGLLEGLDMLRLCYGYIYIYISIIYLK